MCKTGKAFKNHHKQNSSSVPHELESEIQIRADDI